MVPRMIENAPALKLDKVLFHDRPNNQPPVHVRQERRIVWNLLKHLLDKGWHVTWVDDGEERKRVQTSKDAMELIFNLDEARVFFSSTTSLATSWLSLTLGNGIDVLHDYGVRSGFSEAVDSFNAGDYA